MRLNVSLSNPLNRFTRAQSPVKLRSRRGEGGMIWTVMVIAAVAAIAVFVLVPVYNSAHKLGANAKTDLNAVKFP